MLTVVLLVTTIPSDVFALEQTDIFSETPQAAAKESKEVFLEDQELFEGDPIGEIIEIEELREENVKHFALADGTYTAIVYPTAVHRKDENGVWRDIDNSISLKNISGNQKYSTSDMRVDFVDSFTMNSTLMTLNEDGYKIGVSLLGDPSDKVLTTSANTSIQTPFAPTVTNTQKESLPKTNVKLEDVAKIQNKSSIVYSNVKPNLDIEYILDGNDIKENIIIKQASSEYVYSFELLLEGLNPQTCSDGSILLMDSDTGKTKYIIPAPYMYDASGELSYDVEYSLRKASDGRYILIVSALDSWINASNREFPVTIDPTITDTSIMCDTYVSRFARDESYYDSTELLVGDGYTALMQIDLPVLPSGAVPTQVFLNMNCYLDPATSANDAVIGTYQITSSWQEDFTTYNDMPTISSERLSSATLMGDMGTSSDPYMLQMSIFGAAEGWYSGDANNGIALKYEDGTATAIIKSYDSGSAFRQFISVNYTYDFPEGVYALENSSFSNRWMTVEGDSVLAGSNIQHVYSSTSPAASSNFDRSSLFKITKVENSDRYVIRSMLNNTLGIGLVNGEIVTKQIPALDEDVPKADTFTFEWRACGFIIRPYYRQSCIAMTSTSTSDLSLKQVPDQIDAKGIWKFTKYTGTHQSGMEIQSSNTLTAGTTVTFTPYPWTTYLDYNIPFLGVTAGYENIATLSWNETTQIATVTLHDSGDLSLDARIYKPNISTSYKYVTYVTTVSLPFPEGTYYIINKKYGSYIQISEYPNGYYADGAKLEVNQFVYEDYQRWEFTHVLDGYYKIVSAYSGGALSAEGDYVVQREYTGASNMLWKVDKKNNAYVIRPKQEVLPPADFCISTPSDSIGSPHGLYVTQETYSNNEECNDEWYLCNTIGTDVFLLGVTDPRPQHDHCTVFGNVISNLYSLGYSSFNVTVAQTFSRQTVQTNMENSKIFVSRGHGNYDSTGTCISLQSDIGNIRLHSSDIYDFVSNEAIIDLSDCELMIFVGCYTGKIQGKSLPDAAVAAGAKIAIGFKESIDCKPANDWTRVFFEEYCSGTTLGDAIGKACEVSGIPQDVVYTVERQYT